MYDNLGLETAYKRHATVLVSDGGQRMYPEPEPKGDWAQHAIRVLGVVDNQVRSLRKRQLIDGFRRGDRTGAYWGIGTRLADYGVADLLGVGAADTARLAAVKTRLKRMESGEQEPLINWGYAACDAALRAHCVAALSGQYGVTLADPSGFPYRAAGLA